MKIAGHTMGTPDMTVEEAVSFFTAIGLDGIDLICTDDYKCATPVEVSQRQLDQLKAALDHAQLELAHLTPYAKRLNSPDPTERQAHIDLMHKSILLAHQTGCPALRLWSGDELPGEDRQRAFDLAVDSIRQVAKIASDYGVILNLENHTGTPTVTIKEQLAMIEAAGSNSVRPLLDPGCLTMAPEAETGVEAVSRVKDRLGLVHVKDVIVTNQPEVHHVPVGQGEVGWTNILKALKMAGYEGYLSLEYERRWHPDILPPPEVGMVESLRFVRSVLDTV